MPLLALSLAAAALAGAWGYRQTAALRRRVEERLVPVEDHEGCTRLLASAFVLFQDTQDRRV